jgi:hypothetical protein
MPRNEREQAMAAAIDTRAIRAIFEQPAPDGAFEAQTWQYLRTIGARRRIVFLAFAPKAAGTYFRQAAIYAIDGQLARLKHAQGGRDGRPYLPNVLVCCLDPDSPELVAHIHMQAFTGNRHLIDAFGLKPIIMLRSLPDILASFVDMLMTDEAARAEGLNCQIPDDFLEYDRSRKVDFVVDIIAPWFASYFATWKSFVDDEQDTVCVLHYRNLLRNPAETLQTALRHAGFDVSRAKCESAIARVWAQRESYRFNKGITGRGRSCLSAAQLARVSQLLSYYPQLTPWLPELMGNAGPADVASQVA